MEHYAIQPHFISAPLPVAVYSFCGETNVPEQVVSIRSFLRHAGLPTRYTVISDGTICARSEKILQSIHSCVEPVDGSLLLSASSNESVSTYFMRHPLGRKLAALLAISSEIPAIYADSDVLFFPEAARLLQECLALGGLSYLADCNRALDDRLLKNHPIATTPVNSGFLIFQRSMDWTAAISGLVAVCECPSFFTEQTVVHLAMHDNAAQYLDPKTFIMQLDDQCTFSDTYASDAIALRHYVSPVRHKFWNQPH